MPSAGEEHAQFGTYTQKALTDHESRTLSRLTDSMVPADSHGESGFDVKAPERIDLFRSKNASISRIYTGDLSWFNAAMHQRYDVRFVEASTDQTDMLNELTAVA